jgi:DNA repair exonuclease SbcCD ATPase subunit
MINFKSISYKNFQSVGNAGMKIDLDRSPTTLIGGPNGAGKSNLLEAISYALFGKPLKKVKLAGLINSINLKNMQTECVFTKYGDEYKVIRGEKPKVFKIFKNGELLDQNAASKDYQATLENVIGMDHKLFTQVCLLNRERYIPFMDMGAADRRKVVEDILDINIFGYMNKIVKGNTDSIKAKISDLDYERGLSVTKRDGVERLIEQAKNNVSDQVDGLNQQIKDNTNKIKSIESKASDLEDSLKKYEGLDEQYKKLKDKKQKFSEFSYKFTSKMTDLKKERAFYDDNDQCPTCAQDINEDFKKSIITKVDSKQGEITEQTTKLMDELKKVLDKINDISEQLEEKSQIQSSINTNQSETNFLDRENTKLLNQIKSISEKKVDEGLDDQFLELDKKVNEMDVTLNELILEMEEYMAMRSMLKDDGIKASIVDDYVGFINKRVNEYLNHMGFFINITLDGNFEETINSVNKKDFTYDNLSTGQKTRVNLAILLVLLEVSAMKNSAATNLIFIDELLENLDADGVSLFMNLIKEKMKHKNVFVATQRFGEFQDHFRSELFFKLGEDGFTELVKNS